RHAPGPERLREDHDLDDGGRLHPPVGGRDRDRRPPDHRHGAGAPQHRRGVPELRPVPAHDRVRQRRLPPPDAAAVEGEHPRPRGARPRDGAPGGARGPAPPGALGRALVFDPGLLLMDEPLGALDRNLREQMKAEIRRIHSDVGVTVLYVTHDQEEALTMSDRVALMNRGRIAQLGSAEDLYERPASRFVAEFIGESNLLEGRLEAADGAAVFVAPGGLRLPVRVAGPAPRPGERATLMLRPEKIALAPAGAAASEPATLL